MPRAAPADDPVAKLREICVAYPEVAERLSHGAPTWFLQGKKTLAWLDDHHHGADRLAFNCPAPAGVQAQLIREEPERFFRPAYVGNRGWIGVRIDLAPDWDEIAAIIDDAYRMIAPKKLLVVLEARQADDRAAVQAFNQAINDRDLRALKGRMTEDHRFIDSEGKTVSGMRAVGSAWKSFFAAFPDYRNVFEDVESTAAGFVTVRGFSRCSDPRLDGPACWLARVDGDRISQWRVTT